MRVPDWGAVVHLASRVDVEVSPRRIAHRSPALALNVGDFHCICLLVHAPASRVISRILQVDVEGRIAHSGIRFPPSPPIRCHGTRPRNPRKHAGFGAFVRCWRGDVGSHRPQTSGAYRSICVVNARRKCALKVTIGRRMRRWVTSRISLGSLAKSRERLVAFRELWSSLAVDPEPGLGVIGRQCLWR